MILQFQSTEPIVKVNIKLTQFKIQFTFNPSIRTSEGCFVQVDRLVDGLKLKLLTQKKPIDIPN